MERILVPEDPPIPAEGYAGRNWSPMQRLVEPGYVSYGRLLFEDKNSERYGWDLGVLQPFVSAGLFYCDLVKLPYHLATDPCRSYECSAGYCLPGDPVPYLLYPPGASLTGTFAETAAVMTLIAIFP